MFKSTKVNPNAQGMARYWIGTLNNPKEHGEDQLKHIHNTLKAEYTVGQLEKGAEGTAHF